MEIPSGFVYSALPLIATGAVWIAKQFVRSNVRRGDSEPIPRRRSTDRDPEDDAPLKAMSVRQYMELSDLLKRELAGRYMEADEARGRFEDLERKLDKITLHVQLHSHTRAPQLQPAEDAT